ncbi:MAG: protein kinase [Anaerolineae bacterium]|nr:protein kinase [Gemmatimonadaceae bacterium]
MSEVPEYLKEAVGSHYALDRELGRGGMATVYHARDLKHDRSVAVKVLRPELGVLLGTERFLREIKLVANLQHPHILPLYDSGEAEGALYYVMPYVPGDSLRDRLRREHRLPLHDALRIAREVADALYYAHANGLVHRDVKPENILLSNGHAMVCDFGIARAIHASGGGKWQALTETGVAIGTPAYMSPEQIVGEVEIDSRSDIYSLGCVVYEMLTGSPPGTGADGEINLARRFTHPPPVLSEVLPDIPPGVESAVTRALARLPADRFANAREFADALWSESITGQRTAPLVVPTAAPFRRSRAPWLAGGVTAALGVVAIVWFAMSSDSLDRESGTRSMATDSPRASPVADMPAVSDTTQVQPRATNDPAPAPTVPTEREIQPETQAEVPVRLAPRTPAPRRVTPRPAAEIARANVAAREDSILAALRTDALRARTRGVAIGASPSHMAAGDALLKAADAAASQDRFSEAVNKFSSAASAWLDAERAAAAARDSQQRREVVAPKPAVDSPPPAPSQPVVIDQRPAIRAAVAEYARAIESRNVQAIREVYPAMTAAQQREWRAFFSVVRDVKVRLEVSQLDIAENTAEVRANGVYHYENTSTRRIEEQPVVLRVSLRREGDSWRLSAVR